MEGLLTLTGLRPVYTRALRRRRRPGRRVAWGEKAGGSPVFWAALSWAASTGGEQSQAASCLRNSMFFQAKQATKTIASVTKSAISSRLASGQGLRGLNGWARQDEGGDGV